MNAAPLLAVSNLSIRFAPTGQPPVQAVMAANFALLRGQLSALSGPSGAGKSALGHCLLGLLPHTAQISGQATMEGVDLCALDERSWRALRGRRVAGVFQEPHAALNPVASVGRQLRAVCRRHQTQASPTELCQQVGLEDGRDWLRSLPHELSGGQAQRVLIAMALACNPLLLVADEPTAALDPVSAVGVMQLLQKLARDQNMAVLLISHDRELIAAYADCEIRLEAGKTRAIEALAHPKSAQTAPNAAPPSPGEALLQVTALEVWHGSGQHQIRAVAGVDLELRRAEILALVGASGSGKSTLARALVGLHPAGGELRLGAERLDWSRPQAHWRATLQLLFQDPYTALNPRRRVAAVLAEALQQVGRPSQDAAACLDEVGLSADYLSRFPHQLSGGQRQRVALARALAVRPKILLLDEAFSALDIPVRQDLTQLVVQLRDRLGLACLLISHDLARLTGVADRVAIMHNGAIVETGPCDQVLNNPQHPVTRDLLAVLNR